MKSRATRRPRARARRTPAAEPTQPPRTEVNITPAKGRPMLTWVGKRPLSHVTAFPAQHIETFDPAGMLNRSPADPGVWKNWPSSYPEGGLLFHGDNKEVLAHLLANGLRGKVNLIYIDPPFDSGADYVRKISLRGPKGTAKLDGEGYTLGEQIQYTDIWANDNYLQFMYERLLLLKELVTEDGTIFVHTDWHKTHHIRSLLDEVFGPENFRNEIVVKRGRKKSLQKQFEQIDALGVETDTVLLYSKSPSTKLRILTTPERAAPEQWQSFWRGNVERPSMQYEILGFRPTHGQNLWGKERGLRAAVNYKAFLEWKKPHPDKSLLDYWKQTGEQLEFVRNEPGARAPEYWVPPKEAGILGNEWLDIEAYAYGYDYKTEKHTDLLERILELSSNPGDIVLDCFIGSGTTAATTQESGRRWIACDINKGAIQTTSKRLQTIIQEQLAASAQEQLSVSPGKDSPPPPAQLAFTVWRVNDYDLAIQHNEAVNLACEHIGVQRTRTDPYFDGTLGKSLVKIIPFDHPLFPVDLEELRRELDARPDEDRAITLVCLGMELVAQTWVEDWNHLRKGKNAINRIEVIELRTDPKYGKFIKHEPARARVKVARQKDKIVVEIQDFISPTIIERLQQQAGILSPKIDDWRAMVDVVMIDPAYDGKVFNVSVSDVPERKSDLVAGRYELPAPRGETTVAVKIIDMLGEEVLATATV